MRAGELRDARRRRGGRADPRRARARPRPRDRASRRQAVERAARSTSERRLDPAARLRARAFDEAETLTAVGDVPGTLAYISPERLARRGGRPRERRLGGRRPALGGARGQASVLGRAAAADGRGDRGRRAAARSASGPTCRSGCSPRSSARSTGSRAAALGRGARRTSSARPRPPAPSSDAQPRPSRTTPGSRAPARQAVRERGACLPALAGARDARGRRLLPFYPAGWPLALGAARRACCARRAARSASRSRSPRRSSRSATSRSGSRCSTRALAAAWLALSWREAARRARRSRRPPARAARPDRARPARRAAGRAASASPGAPRPSAAVALAAIVAGMRGARPPFGADRPDARSRRCREPRRGRARAARRARRRSGARRRSRCVLAAIAVAIPFARRGPGGSPASARLLLATTLLVGSGRTPASARRWPPG